jgi:NAD(P)-dependent dehydrogenase (short-subunit alcohol dehydrogenase family)
MNTTLLPQMPSMRLDGRRALVTGAGRGIGAAAATALAEAGARVTLCARTAAEIDAVAAALREKGLLADTLALDVTNIGAFRAAVDAREPYDVFVNNAGGNRPNVFTDVSAEDYDAVMGLNVRAAFFAAQSVVRRMIQAGVRGSIIHMSSQMAHVGGAARSLYCASKWAVEGFSKSMAVDLASYGIRSNTVCPTFIETSMTRPFLENAAFKQSVQAKIQLGRLGPVQDLMGAIVFLAGDASSLMTGSSILIDGGWTAD